MYINYYRIIKMQFDFLQFYYEKKRNIYINSKHCDENPSREKLSLEYQIYYVKHLLSLLQRKINEHILLCRRNW